MKMTEEKQTEEEQHIDLRKIRETFAKDRFATENGAIIEEVREHYARCSIELTERHYNAAGGVMGGVHFVLADFALERHGSGVLKLHDQLSRCRKRKETDCGSRMCQGRPVYRLLPGECYR